MAELSKGEIDAEKKRTPPSSMIVKYEGYQFFTGLGHLNHLLLMEHLEWLSLEREIYLLNQ